MSRSPFVSPNAKTHRLVHSIDTMIRSIILINEGSMYSLRINGTINDVNNGKIIFPSTSRKNMFMGN